MTVRDTSFCKVVRREFDVDAVAHQDADTITTHAAGDRGEDNVVSIVYLYLKVGVRLLVDHDTSHLNKFFFHTLSLLVCINSGTFAY